MAKPYRLDGKGNWFFFSEKAGEVVDAGPDEAIALTLAESGESSATIAEALSGKDIDEDSPEPALPSPAGESPDAHGREDGLSQPRESSDVSTRGDGTRKSPAISPQFLRKIKEKAASGTASISIELERFAISRFGFTTEELMEDDPDVELLVLGWQLQWEYWLAGKEPPAWVLILFGQVCVTTRLLASAKRKEKKPPELKLVEPPIEGPPNAKPPT